jgi:deoxyribodipyrimidine photo-lyase
MLPEWVVVGQVLKIHNQSTAGKFIDEVCWHTYAKGWLEQHPSVWTDYLKSVEGLRDDYAGHTGYHQAICGQTGIDCFDAWSKELIVHGYLHNHARMWFASIWIHTLKLPWALGAAFFLEHLYDGDAGANTLGWRWVAGLHTPGKSYLARADNIAKYTDGRFQPARPLADTPIEFGADEANPAATPIQEADPLPQEGRIGLLIHEDDLSAAQWISERCPVIAHCALFPEEAYQAERVAPAVVEFRKNALIRTVADPSDCYTRVSEVVAWAKEKQLNRLVLAKPPIGLWRPLLPHLKAQLEDEGIQVDCCRHWWDAHFFPKANAGFFKLKKAIPKALQQL